MTERPNHDDEPDEPTPRGGVAPDDRSKSPSDFGNITDPPEGNTTPSDI